MTEHRILLPFIVTCVIKSTKLHALVIHIYVTEYKNKNVSNGTKGTAIPSDKNIVLIDYDVQCCLSTVV